MERKLKKIFILFFCIMLFFTVVSRVAASIMVAKVDVGKVREDSLTYEISGTGLVKENAQKYIDLLIGFKISQVNVKEGQPVEKGNWLFSYDLNQLKERISDLETELEKINLEYEKAALSSSKTSIDSSVATANMAEQAAEQDLSQAEADLEELKNEAKDNKQKEYDNAVLELDTLNDSKEEALKTAKRAVLDTEKELARLEKPIHNLIEVLSNYKSAVESKSESQIAEQYNKLFDLYYDGEYEAHKEKVYLADKALQRAKEDLADIQKKWNKIINITDDQLVMKEAELKNANRAVSDADDYLNQVKKGDNRLSSAIQNYRYNIWYQNTTNLQSSYDVLYGILYDSLDLDEDLIAKAKTQVDRAKEDEAEIQKKWDESLQTATEKMERLSDDLQQMKNGTYQYEKELKEGKRSVRNAKRALSSAKEQLVLANQSSSNTQKSIQLNLSSLEIDRREKQEEMDEINKIIKADGKIFSPIDGTISKNELTLGATITGGEKLLIATGGYELLMTADKEDMEQFSVGNEILIKMNNDNEDITTQIENIELPDENGSVRFTALLPEGNYREDASLAYEMKQDSKKYPMCIPIQAVREDMEGTYILIVKEKDGVLGKEQTAFKISITVLSQDLKNAAISAALSEDDRVIVGSSKNIEEGDRVQVNETN